MLPWRCSSIVGPGAAGLGGRRQRVVHRCVVIPAQVPDLPGGAPGPLDRSGTFVSGGDIPTLVAIDLERRLAFLGRREANRGEHVRQVASVPLTEGANGKKECMASKENSKGTHLEFR